MENYGGMKLEKGTNEGKYNLFYFQYICTKIFDISVCLKKEILSLCNKIYNEDEWHEEFMEKVLLPILKKNNAKKCKEFRTISLISHTAKILLRILHRWLRSKMEEEQFGFRKGKVQEMQLD